MGQRALAAAACAAVLALTACGDDEPAATGGTTTTAAAGPTTTGPLPGERVELFPRAGAALVPVGIPAGQMLEVRSGPGTGFGVAFTLPPLHRGAAATGHTRQLPDRSFWSELRDGSRQGWVPLTAILEPGEVTDPTARLYPDPATRPSAATLDALARSVAGRLASQDPPSRVTIVDGPHLGDLGEVTVDVVGVPDDSIGGFRLHIFAERTSSGFRLRTVEQTVLCRRGTDGRLCV